MAKLTDAEKFRRLLIEERTRRGVSQRTLVAELVEHGADEITHQALGKWERGQSLPGRENALALARLFGRPEFASLLGFDARSEEERRMTDIELLERRVEETESALTELRQQTAEILKLLKNRR